MSISDEEYKKLLERINSLENTIEELKDNVETIKQDIYDDDSYDFEIVCPYCNHEFIADVSSELKDEIECPECHKTIELDWGDDCGCGNPNCHCGDNCNCTPEDNCGCGCCGEEDDM